MKKTIFWVLFIIIIGALVEGVSYLGLFTLEKFYGTKYEPADVISARHKYLIKDLVKGKSSYIKYSPSMGWSIRRNGKYGIHRSNSLGVRSSREYERKPPMNKLRIAAFGDSFTHCDGVRNEETWEATLESLDPQLEVMNFGVWSYGLDQAYLRYLEDGRQFKPHIVFIGFMTENIFRHVNVFRPFYLQHTEMPLTKPRFIIKDNKLVLLPNPIRRFEDYRLFLNRPKSILSTLGINDYHYLHRYNSTPGDFSATVRLATITANTVGNSLRKGIIVNGYYNETSEAFIITKKLFDNFYKSVIFNDSVPVILIFPNQEDIARFKRHGTKQYLPLLEHLNSKEYRHIDLMDAFVNAGKRYSLEDLFDSHFSPLANKLVAEHIHSYLNRFGLSRKANEKN